MNGTALPVPLVAAAQDALEAHRRAGTRLAMAESCTGGLVSAALTSIAGSSDVFVAGYVTYANEAKVRMVGVDPVLIERDGAVSRTVAEAMAEGALERSGADLAVSITGIAGPGGGSDAKPVGTVWMARATTHGDIRSVLKGYDAGAGRNTIRFQAALDALALSLP